MIFAKKGLKIELNQKSTRCVLRILKNRVILGILESGRLISLMIPREERVCNCDTDIQTLAHYMLNIPVLTGLKR